jgi:hypothetical protein
MDKRKTDSLTMLRSVVRPLCFDLAPFSGSRALSCHPIAVVTGSGREAKTFDHLCASVEIALSRSGHSHLRVAVDCEGVNLSRHGSLEIVALNFEAPVKFAPITYIVDVGLGSPDRKQRVKCLKRLLTSSSIEKVMHDCRQDSEVLSHFCEIDLANVHSKQ